MIGLYAEASYLLVLRIRKNQRDSIREQENKHVLPGSIIAVVATGVNRFCSFEQTASVGPGALERGDRAVGSSRDHTNQCSARVGIGPARTSGVSTLARVVSGCQTQKWEKAPRSGCNLLLCPIVALDRASVGK